MRIPLAIISLILCVAFCSPPAHALTFAGKEDNLAYVQVQQLGYDGTGEIIGVIDMQYVRPDHVTFWVSADCQASRVTKLSDYGGNTGWGDGHANACAGIAAGRGVGDGTFLGVAPGAQIWSASTSGNEPDIRQAFLDYTTPDVNGKKTQIFSMSLVADIPDCGTYPFTAFFDWLATNRGALVAVGTGTSNDKIGLPGGSYNQLTVGGLNQSLTAWSPTLGHGPTGDGRSKPDVVAPSSMLFLPGQTSPNAWYQNPYSFDSLAIPFAAGVTAMIKQYGDQHSWAWDPRVAKAVIMNSATKLPGWTHTDTHPVDEYQGAGRLNAEWAIYEYAAGQQAPGSVARRGWDLNTARRNSPVTYTFSQAAKPGFVISATMDWWRYTQPADDNILGYNWVATKFANLDLYL